MCKMLSFSLFLIGLSTVLAGCGTTVVETYHPGYYQEGRWVSGGYMPAYYDVYGNLHPAQQVQAYYQEGQWHRPYMTTNEMKASPILAPSGDVVDPLATAVALPSDVKATVGP